MNGAEPEYRQKIKFTGIVATYNEAARLNECLSSLYFCDQIIQVDMGSDDRSVEIGEKSGVDLVKHERVDVVEELRERIVHQARNDWIIFLDPDEVFPGQLINEIVELISSDENVGSIMVPWQFYFKGSRLDCTVWGGRKHKQVFIHRDRVTLTPNVHRGFELNNGFKLVYLEPEKDLFIRHYWVDTYRELFAKHSRYIEREGESRFNTGERFSWYQWIRETARSLKINLIDHNGLKGGVRGIFLSTFFAYYINRSLLSLRRYQKGVSKVT